MNTASALLVLTAIALATAAALYSNYRLGIDRNTVHGAGERVSWLLEDRHSMIEVLLDIAEHATEAGQHDELNNVRSSLTRARQALHEFRNKAIGADATTGLSMAENALIDSLQLLIDQLDREEAIATDVSYQNQKRQLHRRGTNLDAATAAYNAEVAIYRRRMTPIWVQPFAGLFGHDQPGELAIRSFDGGFGSGHQGASTRTLN